MSNDPHNYMFSDVPNNAEGKELVRLMKKYLNKDRYKMRTRGQYLIDSEKSNWRYYSHGQPMNKSKCIRVYIEDHIKKEIDYNYHVVKYTNAYKVRKIRDLSNEILEIE
tara:strand:+ start:1929 stop:2255 length:327 start_codon:yes stop_codon:yes gene_type:complete